LGNVKKILCWACHNDLEARIAKHNSHEYGIIVLPLKPVIGGWFILLSVGYIRRLEKLKITLKRWKAVLILKTCLNILKWA